VCMLQRRGGRGGRGDSGGPTGWMIDSSIFARRRLEAEGKQYFDTPDIFKKRCQVRCARGRDIRKKYPPPCGYVPSASLFGKRGGFIRTRTRLKSPGPTPALVRE
jgi:hypothetical protein